MHAAETVPDEKGGRVFLPAAVATALALAPVLMARHLPLLDAPGHESRLAVLRDLLVTGRGSAFYDLGSFFLPNVAFDVIGLGLTTLTAPEMAGRIFFALTLALTLWGVLVLNRVAIGRWSLAPLASALFLYNLISIMGFFSYAFGLALAPWALAARLKLERAPALPAFLAGAAMGIALLFCHAFDFGIYAAMSFGFSLIAMKRRRLSLGRIALWWMEFVPPILLFFLMSTGSGGGRMLRYEPHFAQIKLFGIVKSVTSGSLTGDLAFLAGAAALLMLIVACARTRVVTSFVPGLILLFALYLALPFELASGSYVDKRMPIAIALMGLAALDVRIRKGAVSSVLVGLIALCLVVKQGALTILWRSFDPPIDRMLESLNALPAGAIIMQAECEPESGDVMAVYRERQPSMTHLSALATIDGLRFVASTWAIGGQQPIAVKPAYRPYYDLQLSFGNTTCDPAEYRKQLQAIRDLAAAGPIVGDPASSRYFLLIRPPQPKTLAGEARLIAQGRDYELYAVGAR